MHIASSSHDDALDREPSQRRSRWIPVAAVLLTGLVLPALTLSFAEITLRWKGYGADGRVLVETGFPGRWARQFSYIGLFHPHGDSPKMLQLHGVLPFLMEHPKPEDVYRIFVLGGSTAEGFPYFPAHSFGNMAGVLLEGRTDGRRVEVINLGYAAMSSYYVRETARRIRSYEPDMLVVYSGHNEYYGTVGAGSGAGHRRKLLYIRLQGLRVFQWLLRWAGPGQAGMNGEQGPETVMEQVLDAGRFARDERRDRVVAQRFVDNMEAVRRSAVRMGIPLVVIEPVSNLISMPPFDGELAEELEDLIAQGLRALLEDSGDVEAWRLAVSEEPRARHNAHLLYLEAIDSARQGSESWLADYLAARDADTLPFRAREALRAALADWAAGHPECVTYIPLHFELISRVGRDAFSDVLFVDHLHFNHQGHQVLARILADAVAELMHAAPGVTADDWMPADALQRRIFYHPALEALALLTMAHLMDAAPFSGMRIPYRGTAVANGLHNNALMQDGVLRERLDRGPKNHEQALPVVGDYFIQNKRWDDVAQLLFAMKHVNPGNFDMHFSWANFMASMGVQHTEVFDAFGYAYLLSGRQQHIREAMVAYAHRNGFDRRLERFDAEMIP